MSPGLTDRVDNLIVADCRKKSEKACRMEGQVYGHTGISIPCKANLGKGLLRLAVKTTESEEDTYAQL